MRLLLELRDHGWILRIGSGDKRMSERVVCAVRHGPGLRWPRRRPSWRPLLRQTHRGLSNPCAVVVVPLRTVSRVSTVLYIMTVARCTSKTNQ